MMKLKKSQGLWRTPTKLNYFNSISYNLHFHTLVHFLHTFVAGFLHYMYKVLAAGKVKTTTATVIYVYNMMLDFAHNDADLNVSLDYKVFNRVFHKNKLIFYNFGLTQMNVHLNL